MRSNLIAGPDRPRAIFFALPVKGNGAGASTGYVCGTTCANLDQRFPLWQRVMEIFPASMVVLLVWLLVSLRVPGSSIAMTIIMLPFGMFAIILLPSLGGLSITAAVFFAALAASLAAARLLLSGGGRGEIAVSPATLALAGFTIYAAFSSLVLVRYFQGSFLVFPVVRGATGERIDPSFPSVLAPVWPSNGNLSQTFHILIGFAFFVAFSSWIRRAGPARAEQFLAIAAGVNIALALINALGLDALLAWVQTAAYTLHDQQTMAGMRRVIGGFPEPAPFGAMSAVFCGYFLSAWGHSYRPRDLILGVGNGAFAVLSYSTTGLAALGVVLLLLLLRFVMQPRLPRDRRRLILSMATIFAVLAMLAAVVVATPLLNLADDLFNRLFLSRLSSLSGQERSAWAQSGMNAFYSTWGLGAGAGSLRSNGLFPSLLGSVGAPGTLFFLGFLWLSIGRSARVIRDATARRVYASAQIAAAGQLFALTLSSTVADPTLLLLVCCAMTVGARADIPDRATAPDSPGIPTPATR